MTRERPSNILDRRHVIGLGLSFLASSLGFLTKITEVEAQIKETRPENLREIAHKFGKEAAEQVETGVQYLERKYLINIRFEDAQVTELDSHGGTFTYTALHENIQKIHALRCLTRQLLPFPPNEVEKYGLIPLSDLVKEIVISSTTTYSRRDGTKSELNGLAYPSKGIIRLPIRMLAENEKQPELVDAFYRSVVAHEIAHLYFTEENFPQPLWEDLVVEKVKTYSPAYSSFSRSDMPQYQTSVSSRFVRKKTPRPLGFVNHESTEDYAEDIAYVVGELYEPAFSPEELDKEIPPVLRAKIEVMREQMNQKFGFTDQERAKLYWLLVQETEFYELKRAVVRVNPQHKKHLSDLIRDESALWEKFWKGESVTLSYSPVREEEGVGRKKGEGASPKGISRRKIFGGGN